MQIKSQIASGGHLIFGRLYREERMMVDQFDDRYRNYAMHIARVVAWHL